MNAERLLGALRVVTGASFAVAGVDKVFDHGRTVDDFGHWGVPLPELSSVAVAGVELTFGLLLCAGVATAWATLPLIGDMLGAIVTAGRVDGGPHLVLPPLLAVACIAIALRGGGRWQRSPRALGSPPTLR